MGKLTDQKYLVISQYRNAANLNTRLEFHRNYGTNPISWFNWVFDQFRIPENAKLLELGCGNGALWQQNKDRIPANWKFVISDLSNSMLQEAKRNLPFIANRAVFQVLDAQLLKYNSNTFDAVVANHMLYHIPNIPRALLEIHRVLKKGCKLYATTNGENHMQGLRDILLRYAPLNEKIPKDSYFRSNCLSFTLENGREFLETIFEKVDMSTYEDKILLTSPDPFLEYTLSIEQNLLDSLTKKQFIDFKNYLHAYFKENNNEIYIEKSTGMFIAQK